MQSDDLGLVERLTTKRSQLHGDWLDAMEEAAAAIERLEANEKKLRRIISECAAALPNGAFISPEVSIEFMANLPAEIKACFERLVAERDEARKDTERLDFLDRCNATLNAHYGTTYRWELILNGNVNRLMLGHMVVDLNDQKAGGLASCRDAIDGPLAKSRARNALGDT